MARATFRDKRGRKETFDIAPGEFVRDILRAQGIPRNSVITTLNGEIVSEDTAVVDQGDVVEFQQVRHYDLGLTRSPVHRRVGMVDDPIYTNSILFDVGGNVEIRSDEFDAGTYPAHVEYTFVESVTRARLLGPGQRAVVGLSGGQDSVAFLTLLERTRAQFPNLELTAVTVTGLPDWDEPGTFRAALDSCARLEIDHVIVEDDEIVEVFNLDRPYVDVMNDVLDSPSAATAMVATHHVMRRMLEVVAESRGIDRIVLGLNADDLMATLVTWYMSGFRMGPLPLRPVGPLIYVFPLYRLTKKELTLYLQLVAPQLAGQGPPGTFTTGPGERSLVYAITDHLFDLWPGVHYFAFDAFSVIQRELVPDSHTRCDVCGGSYLVLSSAPPTTGLCDICQLFALITSDR